MRLSIVAVVILMTWFTSVSLAQQFELRLLDDDTQTNNGYQQTRTRRAQRNKKKFS